MTEKEAKKELKPDTRVELDGAHYTNHPEEWQKWAEDNERRRRNEEMSRIACAGDYNGE